jgi:hypothetical protein
LAGSRQSYLLAAARTQCYLRAQYTFRKQDKNSKNSGTAQGRIALRPRLRRSADASKAAHMSRFFFGRLVIGEPKVRKDFQDRRKYIHVDCRKIVPDFEAPERPS